MDDLTSEIQSLGDPIAFAYDKPEEKNKVFGLTTYHNRIYLAHGTTDTKIHSQFIYFDLEAEELALELDQGGNPLELAEERIGPFAVLEDGKLYCTSIDPIGSRGKFIRKNGKSPWTIRQGIGPDAHYRTIMKRGEAIFIHFGYRDASYPSMLVSWDDGASFERLEQPEVSSRHMGYQNYFIFKDEFYVASFSPHFLSRYTGDRLAPFEIVYAEREELLPGGRLSIYDVAEVGGYLVFKSDQLYRTANLHDPSSLEPFSLPGKEVGSFKKYGDELYVHMYEGAGPWTHRVFKTTDGVSYQEVFHFTSIARNIHFARAGGYFYWGAGGAASELFRIPSPEKPSGNPFRATGSPK